jgi:hypothetical protein
MIVCVGSHNVLQQSLCMPVVEINKIYFLELNNLHVDIALTWHTWGQPQL